MINLSGQKMSKSEGNIKLLNEYVEIYGGNTVRFFYLRSHYRKPQEFTEDLLKESKTTFNRIAEIVREVKANPSDETLINIFKNSMNDDLNTPKFLGEVFEKINNLNELNNQESQKIKETLKYIFETLGFKFINTEQQDINEDKLVRFFDKFEITFENIEQAMEEFNGLRDEMRKNKNYEQADLMRNQLKEIGILIKDGETSGWYWENC